MHLKAIDDFNMEVEIDMISATQTLSSEAAIKNNHHLINGFMDTLFIGGLSILAYIAIIMFAPDVIAPNYYYYVFLLSFVINFPHFLLSYQLLYGDNRKLILKNWRFCWAGIIMPSTLILLLLIACYQPKAYFGYFVNAMFFFVGWHYVKQIFGGVIVLQVLQQIYYQRVEYWILRINLYAIWIVNFVWSNISYAPEAETAIDYYGISYYRLALSPTYLSIGNSIVALSFAAVLLMHIKKYLRERRLPPLAAVACYLSIYLWFFPPLNNPIFYFIVPFFHSLQYIPFVYALKRNKVQMQDPANKSPTQKLFYKSIYLWGYLLLSIITGASFFWFIPNYLDKLALLDQSVFGPTPAMFAFLIFINIHHFFMDNVLWKGNNPEIKQYLFKK